MYPRRWLIVSGLGAFVLGLLLCAPARLLVSMLPLERWALVPQAASGTLLAGDVRLHAGAGPLYLSWRLQPVHLLALSVRADWRAELDGMQADGQLDIAPWRARLDVQRADIDVSAAGRLLAPWRASVDQPLAFRQVVLAVAPSGLLRAADGRASWGPGALRVEGRPPRAMPALRGRLQPDGVVAELVIDSETAPGETLASVRYDTSTRELHVTLFQRGADLLGQPASPPRAPGTAVFEMRQSFR